MRELKVQIKRSTGVVHNITLIMNNKMLDSGPGAKGISWKGKIPDKAKFLVHAVGVKNASYEMAFDLPGTASDFKQTFTLEGTSQKLEFAL